MAAYTSVGADPSLIITASSMAAPAALAYAKLFYPETKKTKTSSTNIVLHKRLVPNVVVRFLHSFIRLVNSSAWDKSDLLNHNQLSNVASNRLLMLNSKCSFFFD